MQRSSILVVRCDTLMQFGWGKLYSEASVAAGITTERADLTLASWPVKLMAQSHKPMYAQVQRQDADFCDRLQPDRVRHRFRLDDQLGCQAHLAAGCRPCRGLGSGTTKDPGPWQGELRNMWKPTAPAGLWFHGGNLQQSRSYSLYLALQLKARMQGLATPVYQPAR